MFGAPAVLALGLVLLEPWLAPSGTLPLPMWVIAILGVDVAHVWATGYRTYLDPKARQRWKTELWRIPLLSGLVGWGLAWWDFSLFWRVLAYMAVFHFVRQQYGWVLLYHQKDGRISLADRWLDKISIYTSMLFPLLWWHAHLPRAYHWFLPGDFVLGLIPIISIRFFLPLYVLILVVFVARQLQRAIHEGHLAWGKTLLVTSTAACWGVGIILTNSDWAFTVTNVFVHGVPYIGFVWHTSSPQGHFRKFLGFYGVIFALAFSEEFLWDRYIWHSGEFIFGPVVHLSQAGQAFVMSVLAVPQLTHYLLDGLIWRKKSPE